MKPYILLKAGPENVARAEAVKYIHQVWNKINDVVVKSLIDVFADDHQSDHKNWNLVWDVAHAEAVKYFQNEYMSKEGEI